MAGDVVARRDLLLFLERELLMGPESAEDLLSDLEFDGEVVSREQLAEAAARSAGGCCGAEVLELYRRFFP